MEQSCRSGDRKVYEDELPRSVLYSGYGLRVDDVALRHQSSRSGSAGGGSAGRTNGVDGAFAKPRCPGRIFDSTSSDPPTTSLVALLNVGVDDLSPRDLECEQNRTVVAVLGLA